MINTENWLCNTVWLVCMSDKHVVVGSNPATTTMKTTYNIDGTITIDMYREFKKFLWKSRFMMWRLSIDRDFTIKEKIKIFITGRI